MNEPSTPMAVNDPNRTAPAPPIFARLAAWVRAQLLTHRIWIILPGQESGSGQTLVLPFSLARLIHKRAREVDQPVEALLPVLLRTALRERRPPDPVELAWRSLTEREREVACLIVAGLSNRQIAARLMVSRNTIRTHARRIVRKFGCPNRKGLPDLRPYCSGRD